MRGRTALLILASAIPAARAETMLEQARLRGAAVERSFSDDPTRALPEVPWTSQTRDFGSLSVAVDRAQWHVIGLRDQFTSIGLTGQIRHYRLEQPKLVGMWGQSWGIRLNANAAADKAGLLAYGDAEAEFGTIATISERGHGIYLRFAGQVSMAADPQYSSGIGLVSIPFGIHWDLSGAALELGAVPALGWASVSNDDRQLDTGPVFLGGEAKLLTKLGWLELQHLRAVTPADATTTLLSACAQQGRFSLCADGGWLQLHDLGNGAPGRYSHIGLHFGVASFVDDTEKTSRVAVTPWR